MTTLGAFFLGVFIGAFLMTVAYVSLMLYIANRSGAKVGE